MQRHFNHMHRNWDIPGVWMAVFRFSVICVVTFETNESPAPHEITIWHNKKMREDNGAHFIQS